MKILLFLLTLYGLAFLVLAVFQRAFLYHPHRGPESEFTALAGQARVLAWRDGNGNLLGWKRENPRAKNRMLILHGNGGHALSRTYFPDGFGALGNEWEFYLLEYPGYGWRSGSANETEIVRAADEAAQLLLQDARPLFITGESLGTGVASLLAAKRPREIKGLFLVTPYTSIADVAAGRFPIFPTRLAMKDKYEAARALKKYSGPVAILVAGRDYIVPARLGRELFAGYGGPKKLWEQEKAGHNSLDYDPQAKWWKEVSDFLTTTNAR